MTEPCPFCQREVLFVTSVCPSCRSDRDTFASGSPDADHRQAEVMQRQAEEERKDAVRTSGQNDVSIGFAAFLLGLFVTWFWHGSSAYLGAEQYLLFWGPMVYGGCRMVRGAITLVFRKC
jgi:hypothetical protein